MVISWNQYFMGVSKLSALRSKDPSTQVGACIVNPDKKIVAIGYNGLPKGMDDSTFDWTKRDGKYDEQKYAYVVHAEANAILNATTPLKGCALYVSLFPCNECAKLIVQSGITKVFYECDKYKGTEAQNASEKIFAAAGVTLEQVDPVEVEVK